MGNGTKAAPNTSQDKQGLFASPGPWLGIVKDINDVTRAGRIQVYIPDRGAVDQDDESYWYSVSYAGPFRGSTSGSDDVIQETEYNGSAEEENSYQSYGMWFTPPDVGTKVLCVFLNGDPSQGYYFACIGDSKSSHMTPGIGSAQLENVIWDKTQFKTHERLSNYIELASGELPSRLPVSEPTRRSALENETELDKMKKMPHVYQNMRLGMQGLSFDFTRGSTSASSIRESPSQVFGISTPGRLWSFADKEKSLKTISEIQGSQDQETLPDNLISYYKNTF